MLRHREEHTVNQKYDGYIQPLNQDVFEVLNSRLMKVIPNWKDKIILDFGCNVGHLYRTADGALPAHNFFGVDIHKESIDVAKATFPETNWIHFNGWNPTFNPTGERDTLPELPVQPDVIIVYGVFTHMCYAEIQKWLTYLRSILAPGGIIVFSVWENTQFAGYVRFLRNAFGVSVKLHPFGYDNYMYLLNREQLLFDSPDLPKEQYDWIETFYKRKFLLGELPTAQVVDGVTSLHVVYVLS